MTVVRRKKWFRFRRGLTVLNVVAQKYGRVARPARGRDHYVVVRRDDGTSTRWLIPNVRKVA
jgi:hypothetical protein